MRILFVYPRFHTNMVPTIECLINKGHEVVFHAILKGPTEDYSAICPIIIRESIVSKFLRKLFGDGGANKKRFFPDLIGYLKQIYKYKPDIAIIRMHGKVMLYIVSLCVSFLGGKVIYYKQTDCERFIRRLWGTEARRYIRRFRFYLPLSIFGACWFTPLLYNKTLYDTLPIRTYYIPFAVPIVQSVQCTEKKTVTLLCIGKYIERKKHLLLLNVINEIRNQYNIRTIIVGECSNAHQESQYRTLCGYIEEHRLNDIVSLRKNVKYSNIAELYECADIYILPAINECAAVTPLEAMGHGLPVICTDSCGTKTYIEDGYNGYIVKSNELHSLKIAIQKMLSSNDRRIKMSRNALCYAKTYLSQEVYYKALCYLLNKQYGMYCE